MDARGQRTRVKSGMNLSGIRRITSRGPEAFGPQFDKIVIDYCRKTLERASVATVSEVPSHQHLDQPPLLPSAVLSPPEITPPIGLRTASPPPTGRYLWSSFREYDYSQKSTTPLGSRQDTSTWRYASMLDPNVIGFHPSGLRTTSLTDS
ncbi:hypothetical protein LTR99_007137 [Exophiala xenobiotica]|uniref:Uncharacterized protein n=1 Tax=Vermiconidia calcicola TaxID=1690605 RepID=A0AAV9PUG2_9PEZI|nr:hypothetical protein LTR96_005399 [Exophiala xenobiotica]KAK5528929.1 hypothetical protein LTR25_010114 [Vermiconidia calcicola]KAK5544904.1 hypothetical protein LTR23_004033 [Chaetothyriales sp. CCFEE 6169]KAK5300388.1 hypothetical protein LTR99_007137 [Exophiala xenobiotica]KAK5334230.1 hypothetical protein LTR98_009693 [Exophiala xenobiotica]